MTQTATSRNGHVCTAEELFERFGPIPLDRIRTDPPPGLATMEDVERIDAREDRICELVDGILVEKPMGWFESYLASRLSYFLQRYLDDHPIGIVLGEGGYVELTAKLVRVPDVCFISHRRLAGQDFTGRFAMPIAPELAAEVISPSNTRREMEDKLTDYFTHGAALVWYIDPPTRSIRVYTSVETFNTLTGDDVLDGGDVLPGFSLALPTLFEPPGAASE